MNARCMGLIVLMSGVAAAGWAWDYEGHRLINQAALASLPTNFPAFVQVPAARERIAFLGGEPDRWRNTPDLPLRHVNHPDHYIDVEDLAVYGLDPKALTPFRYEFVALLAAERAANPDRFTELAPATDRDRTRWLVGFLPWTITESYARLKSAFSYWKTYLEGGTPEEIANAEGNIIDFMGLLGHYVGDATQPLHTTRHYNGWVGANPGGFTTNRTFHAAIDGTYLLKIGGLTLGDFEGGLRPAKLLWPGPPRGRHENIFPETIAFILEQFQQVEPLYQLEKDGGMSARGTRGLAGKPFLLEQMTRAAQRLADLWYTAWQQAGPDTYLKAQLARRKLQK